MSLETKIEALTAAVLALTAQMQGQAPAPVAPPAPPAPPAPTFAPPAAPLANGMPGGPFTAPAAAPVAPPAAPGAPFNDLTGCTKYAMDAYTALEAKGAGRGEVVTQVITHLCGSGSINDLPPVKYPEFYTIVEQQKAA